MNYDMGISLVSIDSDKSDLFPVNVGLWQRCPLSLVLFIVSMDRIFLALPGDGGALVWGSQDFSGLCR